MPPAEMLHENVNCLRDLRIQVDDALQPLLHHLRQVLVPNTRRSIC